MSFLPPAAARALAAAPPSGSDADLLGRYVTARDNEAFAALVRRHGPMVLAVCRRRLGVSPDADDAFQAVFLVLTRDAGKVVRRESLPGWLHRVASLVALKQAGRAARRAPAPLADHDAADPRDPPAEAASRELAAAVDEELAALPDKLRAVVVLCGLEGRPNAEAAKLLGCPTGTVDSRLAAARARLRARLLRRGLPVAAVAAAVDGAPAALPPVGPLADAAVRAASAYLAAGGAAADPVSSLADGVTPVMGPTKLQLVAVAGMSAALFGATGVGLYRAGAQDGPKPADPPAAKRKADPPAVNVPDPPVADAPRELKTESAVRGALANPVTIPDVSSLTLQALFAQLHHQYGLVVRFDLAAYNRAGLLPEDARPYDVRVRVPVTTGMTVADLLAEVVAEFPAGEGQVSAYQVRGNQVLIVPAFAPDERGPVGTRQAAEQRYGPPVSLGVADLPFAKVVDDLRRQTGANIVLDTRANQNAAQPVTASMDDVRLRPALTVLADMVNLRVVAAHNVYYVTTTDNVGEIERQLAALAPEPKPTAPPAEKK